MLVYYAAIAFCSILIILFFDALFDIFHYKHEGKKAAYYRSCLFLFIYSAALLPLIKYIFTY